MQQYQKSAKEKIDETDDFAESDSDSPYTDEDASPEASLPTQNTSDGALEQLMSNMVDDVCPATYLHLHINPPPKTNPRNA